MQIGTHRRTRILVAAAGLWLAFPGLASGPSPAGAPLDIQRRADGTVALALPGQAPFHVAQGPIRGVRIVPVPGSRAVAAVWEELGADGRFEGRFAVARDGRVFSRALRGERTIHLRYAAFDPLEGVPAVPAALAAAPDTRARIVQFVTTPLPEYQDAIAREGGVVHAYLPHQALIVSLTPAQAERVAAMPFVRWVGPYHHAYKLEDLLLGEQLAGTPAPARRYSIELLERGAAAQAAVAREVLAAGGAIDLMVPQGYRLEATLTGAQLARVAALDAVLFIDRWSPPETDMNIAREISGANYVETVAGYRGEGVRGEVMDSGLRTSHVDFRARPPIMHTSNSSDTWHGTSTYGIVFGDGTGSATARGMLPMGQGIFAYYSGFSNRYTHTEQLLSPPYEAVFQSNSWGSSLTRDYTTISAEMDDIIFNLDILITQSQSNAGTQDSRPQAWAKNIVSVGAFYHFDTLSRTDDRWSGGASIGPARDGRLKPDLSHFYDRTRTPTNTSDTAYYDDFGGTSGATPITAGHFGLFFQMWADGIFGNEVSGGSVFQERPHFATAKAAIINTASQYPFTGTAADLSRYKQGWGIADVKALYDLREKMIVVDEADVIGPFGVNTYDANVEPGEPAFRATLVYADIKGTTSSTLHRINDLSLKVTAPSGTVYWGNNGLEAGNWSTPGGSSNTKDTVENVFVQNPESGLWRVEVFADAVVQDSHPETPEIDADYALVVSGAVGTPPPLRIRLPDGPPPGDTLPGEPFSLNVEVTPGSENVVPGSPSLHVRDDAGAFTDIPLTPLGGDLYRADVPGFLCDSTPEFYFSAQGDAGSTVTLPPGAPGAVYDLVVGQNTVVVDDNFESDAGWTVVNTSLTQGDWQRGTTGGVGRPPDADYDGSGQCWFTDGDFFQDVDGGPTRLVSPRYDCAGLAGVRVSFARYFAVSNADEDRLVTEVSNDDGATWTQVESVGDSPAWALVSFTLDDFVAPTANVRIRFSATDNPNDSQTEAAIDALKITAFSCEDPCIADFNGDGTVNSLDFVDYLNAFNAGDPRADINGDGTINSIDFVAFLNLFDIGCP